uniref:Uncharacterized protein MANES_14G153500 n=1 Tax=Rhizophora mucronata TaxID=61149 RepID=A0A2P2P1B2_RHIMU
MGEEERTDLRHAKEEEESSDNDETLSLSDLPMLPDGNKPERPTPAATNTPLISSSEPPELFEFFSDLTAQMISAEDIISCGQLIPSREHSPLIMQNIRPPRHSRDDGKQISPHSRSESFSGFQRRVNCSNSTKSGPMRNIRSLNYHKLERFPGHKNSWDSDTERNSSANSTGKRDEVSKKTVRPPWFVLMFGMVKPPAEMELRDIKIRQVRRNIPSTMFPPPVDVHGKVQVNRNSGKGSCGLLKVLSCRDSNSVAVTATYWASQA